jgi:transposase InsO family protein
MAIADHHTPTALVDLITELVATGLSDHPREELREQNGRLKRLLAEAELVVVVERSITAERLVTELKEVFAVAGCPPMVLRMDNGPELVSQALQQCCEVKVGLSYIPPGTPWNNGYIESFNNRIRKECLNRNHWTTLNRHQTQNGSFGWQRSNEVQTGLDVF